MTVNPSVQDQLRSCFDAAVRAVDGRQAVIAQDDWLLQWQPEYVVAIGKAACAMVSGLQALQGIQIRAGLVVTAESYCAELLPDRYQCVFGDHPVPGPASLAAGESLLQFLTNVPAGARLLVLVSGGASSQLECLRSGFNLSQLQQLNQWLLGSGLDIRTMNYFRSQISRIKGGGLRKYVSHCDVQVGFISDVQGDDPAVVASGPLFSPGSFIADMPLPAEIQCWMPQSGQALPASSGGSGTSESTEQVIPHRCIASLSHARSTACNKALELGFSARVDDRFLSGEVTMVAQQLMQRIRESALDVLVLGGEPTVCLPPQPGTGGRNQHLALMMAKHLSDEGIEATILCAATDGHDGNSDAAGAIVDIRTCSRLAGLGENVLRVLEQADSGRVLSLLGATIPAFASGTNVMDLVIILKTQVSD